MGLLSVHPFLSYQPANDWDFIMNDNPFIRYRVKSCSLPFLKFSISERKSGEKFYKEVEHPGNFTMEIYETPAYDTYTYFKAWQDSIYNPETRTFNINVLPRSAVLIFNTGFVENSIISFKFTELKLQGFEPLSLNYESGNPLTYSLSLWADEIEPS